MGLDGGTHATRADILRRQSWKLAQSTGTRSTRGGSVSTSDVHQDARLDRATAQLIAWTICLLSGQLLAAPTVCDYLGRFYNRDAVVEYLLGRKGSFLDDDAKHRYLNTVRVCGAAFDNVTSLRDVFTVHLTPATPTSEPAGGAAPTTAGRPADKPSSAVATAGAGGEAPWQCPVTQLPCGRYPFSALPACGHVVSDRALDAVRVEECPVCGQSYTREQLVAVSGSQEQVARLRARLPTVAMEVAARGGGGGGGGSKKRKLRPTADGAAGPRLLEGCAGDADAGARPDHSQGAAPLPALAGRSAPPVLSGQPLQDAAGSAGLGAAGFVGSAVGGADALHRPNKQPPCCAAVPGVPGSAAGRGHPQDGGSQGTRCGRDAIGRTEDQQQQQQQQLLGPRKRVAFA